MTGPGPSTQHSALQGLLSSAAGPGITVPPDCPLWFYCLAEAQANGGTQLGPVAARIVAEVLIRLLAHDPDSYLRQEPV